ncbi:MAG: hypothetical protein ABI330_19575 [Caldimonas sp.]
MHTILSIPKTRTLAAVLLLGPLTAAAVEIYGGVGTTGGEVGLAQSVAAAASVRVEVNALRYSSSFTTSGIDYDTKLEATNAAVYLDAFFYGNVRVSAGALVGRRKMHGTATGIGSTISFNGVPYPMLPGDALDFEATFPTVTPYLGIGYGHHDAAPGLHLYVDAGVAYGRPKVTLSPTASLLAKVNPADLLAEQSSVQDKADRYRAYPVLKVGLIYAF